MAQKHEDSKVTELLYFVYSILAERSGIVPLSPETAKRRGFWRDQAPLEHYYKSGPEVKLSMALLKYILLSSHVFLKNSETHWEKQWEKDNKFKSRDRFNNLRKPDLTRFRQAHHNLMMQLESSSAKSKKGVVLEVYDSVKHLSFPTFDQTNGFHVPQVKIKETKSQFDIMTLSPVSNDGNTPNMVLHVSNRKRLVSAETMEELKDALLYLISKASLADGAAQFDKLRSICRSQLFCCTECKNPSTKRVLGSMSFDMYCDTDKLVSTKVELEFCVKDTSDEKELKVYKLRSTAKTITRLLVSETEKEWYNNMCGTRITELLVELKMCVFCQDAKCTFAAIPYRYTEVKGESSARCPNGHIFCTSCNKKAHGGPCALDEHDVTWLEENKDNMMCPSCRARIQKDGGCNHMHHKICNTHFCATCFRIFPGNVQWADHTGCNQFPPPERVIEDIEDDDD